MLDVDREPVHIVVIDRNADRLHRLETALHHPPSGIADVSEFHIHSFRHPAEAMARMPEAGWVAILCDFQMPGDSGLAWLDDFVRADVGPVLMMNEQGDEHRAAEAFHAGAADYLVTPNLIDCPDELFGAIIDALRRFDLQRRNRELARQLKLANVDLERTNHRLQEMTDTTHRFVDDAAHEFRTPLTVIKEFSSIIADGFGGPVTDQQREYLEFIESATRDLAQMVDDFLDSSKLQSHRLRIDRREHEAADVIESVRPMIEARARLRNITVEIDAADAGYCVFCDLKKAGRIILNLVVNAIKSSNEGDTIRLSVRQEADGDVRFSVSDSGPGLSESELNMLGERFKPVGDSQKSSVKGFGLGLNIARDLVHLNLGRMQAANDSGRGRTLSFTLPSCDCERVLERYIEVQLEQSPTETAAVTHLRLTPTDSCVDAESLRAFVAGVCYPMDLAITSTDGRSVMLLGVCEEPDRWIARIEKLYAERQREEAERAAALSCESDHPVAGEVAGEVAGGGAMTVRWMGTWLQPQHREELMRSVLDQLYGVRASA